MATALENCERTGHNFVLNRDATGFGCSHGCGERRLSTKGYQTIGPETVFVVTRLIAGALMSFCGTIDAGERVSFHQNDGTFYLDYESGAPTRCPPFPDWQSVRSFVEAAGLRLVQRT